MPDDRPRPTPARATEPRAPGLCGRCRHVRAQASARGGVFFRCALSDLRDGFPRYPRLPVRSCSGFAAVADDFE